MRDNINALDGWGFSSHITRDLRRCFKPRILVPTSSPLLHVFGAEFNVYQYLIGGHNMDFRLFSVHRNLQRMVLRPQARRDHQAPNIARAWSL